MGRWLARQGGFVAIVVATSLHGTGPAVAIVGSPAFCVPVEERRAKALDFLGNMPASTPRDVAPHAIMLWFRTNATGIELPQKERSKSSVSVILQHEYRDLVVTPDSIRVTVAFEKIWSRIVVPMNAMIAVYDKTLRTSIDLRPCGRSGL